LYKRRTCSGSSSRGRRRCGMGERGKKAKTKKMAVLPRLRFSDFLGTEGWEVQPLEKLAQRSTRKNTDCKITRVLTNSAALGVIDQRDFFDKKIANPDNLAGYYIVEEGSYVYNPRISVTAPAGPISKNRIGLGVMSPLYTVFKFNQIKNDFYAHYFKTTHWHAFMRLISSTGVRHDRMSITNDAFMKLPLPVCLEQEQQKIADCLSSLDDLIAAETQKLEALKTHKKGLLQQLFPHEGETAPRLRFPEFLNVREWKEIPLANICTINPSRANRQDNDRVSFVPMAAVSEDGYIENFETRSYAEVKNGYTYFYNNDVIIAKITPCFENGKAALVKNLENGAGFGSTEFHVFRTEEGCLPDFLFFQLCRDNIRAMGAINMVGNAGQRRVPASFFKELPFYLPAIEEQQKITYCLSSLDDLISIQSQKLDSLKTHKTGLMQKLFPILDEMKT